MGPRPGALAARPISAPASTGTFRTTSIDTEFKSLRQRDRTARSTESEGTPLRTSARRASRLGRLIGVGRLIADGDSGARRPALTDRPAPYGDYAAALGARRAREDPLAPNEHLTACGLKLSGCLDHLRDRHVEVDEPALPEELGQISQFRSVCHVRTLSFATFELISVKKCPSRTSATLGRPRAEVNGEKLPDSRCHRREPLIVAVAGLLWCLMLTVAQKGSRSGTLHR